MTTSVNMSGSWRVPMVLIAVGFVPLSAGAFRLYELNGGVPLTLDSERAFSMPLPVAVHIASVTLYTILGAFQFEHGLRMRWPAWHRGAGRLLVPSGLVAALSGLWLTQFFPPADYDGPVLYWMRLVVGSAMALFIGLGFAAIRQHDIVRHRAWMIRSYALGLGAGTQAFTQIPYVVLYGAPDEVERYWLMGAGWAINLVVAELFIWRGPPAGALADGGR